VKNGLRVLYVITLTSLYLLAIPIDLPSSGSEFVERAAVIGNISPRAVVIQNPKVESMQSLNVIVGENDVPGRLRFKLTEMPPGTVPWKIHITIGSRTLVIDDQNYINSLVANLVIEVLADQPGSLQVAFSQDAPSLHYVGYLKLTGDGTVLNRFGLLNLEYFDNGFLTDLKRQSLAKAVVRFEYDVPGRRKACTAFQVRPGYFLTNLHCADDPEREIDQKEFNDLYFGISDKNVVGIKTTAKIVARGQSSPESDFAVLQANKVPKEFESSLLLLDEADAPQDMNRPLEMYSVWSHASAPRGKILVRDVDCKVLPPAKHCPIPLLRHGCDAEAGSSGSPILSQNGDRVIAIHHSGNGENGGNCALPVSVIKSQLVLQGIWEKLK
jgi:hypothetical protein